MQVEVISQSGSDGAGGPRVRIVVAEGRKHEVRIAWMIQVCLYKVQIGSTCWSVEQAA